VNGLASGRLIEARDAGRRVVRGDGGPELGPEAANGPCGDVELEHLFWRARQELDARMP
jgi:hypothetical protein